MPWEQWFQLACRAHDWTYEEIARMTPAQLVSVLSIPPEGKIGRVSREEGAALRAKHAANMKRWVDQQIGATDG